MRMRRHIFDTVFAGAYLGKQEEAVSVMLEVPSMLKMKVKG